MTDISYYCVPSTRCRCPERNFSLLNQGLEWAEYASEKHAVAYDVWSVSVDGPDTRIKLVARFKPVPVH